MAWAKGWIASQELGAHLIGPSWGLNKRRYYRSFGTSRFDVILEEVLLRFPHFSFTEAEYRNTGKIDFGEAIREWAKESGLSAKSSFILRIEGMWGGYPSIRSARPFLLSKLLGSRNALKNLYQFNASLDPSKLTVAVHMRNSTGGHFKVAPGETERGRFNILLPLDWYLWVCEALRQHFGDRVQFRFFTDRRGPEYLEAVRRFSPEAPQSENATECSDLLAMIDADLIVCSISSYSLVASFLSEGPYIWYEPQLTHIEGSYSIWGNEESQQAESSPTGQGRKLIAAMLKNSGENGYKSLTLLGNAMAIGDPLPANLISLLEGQISRKDRRTNLLEYGCVPAGNMQ